MPDFEIKANDTRPSFRAWIGYEFAANVALPAGYVETRPAETAGGSRLALPTGYFTGSTPLFVMRAASTTSSGFKLSDAATWRVLESSAAKVDRAATWIDADTGYLEFGWTGADTNTPGPWLAEVEVQWGAGGTSGIETFPRTSYFSILIPADLDRAGA